MKRWIIFIYFVSYPGLGNTQQNPIQIIDSLHRELLYATVDSFRVELWNELAFQWRNNQKDSALIYAEKANKLAVEIKYLKGEGDSYIRRGIIYKNLGKYDLAEENYLKGIDIRKKLGQTESVAKGYNNLGLLFVKQAEFEKAKRYYQKSIEHLNDGNFPNTKARAYNGLARVYSDQGKYQKALAHFTLSFDIRSEVQDTFGMAGTLLDQGILYHRLELIPQAKEYLNRSKKLYEALWDLSGQAKCLINLGNIDNNAGKFESAVIIYEQALAYKEALSEDDLAIIIGNLGVAYKDLGQIEKALTYSQESLVLFQNLNNQKAIASAQSIIGSIYLYELDQAKVAIPYFEKALELHKRVNASELISKDLFHLANAYTKSGHLKKAVTIFQEHRDSFLQRQQAYQDGIVYKDSLEKEQYQSELLKSELALEQTKNSRNKIVIIGLVSILLLGGFLGFVSFLNYHNKKKKEEVEQEVDNLLQEKELKTTYAKLEGQEAERQRLSRELHDGLGALLSAIRINFANLGLKLDFAKKENKQKYQRATERLEDAVDEVRRISHGLSSELLAKFGLIPQLEDLINTLNESGKIKAKLIRYNFSHRLNANFETQIYRILQELIANVLKHANASQLIVQLNYIDDEEILNILVEDNGIGFDIKQGKQKKSTGLLNIESRVNDLKGTIDFDSTKGRGTIVNIDIPVKSSWSPPLESVEV